MAEDTRVKVYHAGMLRAPSLVPNVATSFRDLLKATLVNGFGAITPTSATVTSGVCRVNCASGNSFSPYSTIQNSGADQADFNGQHKVIRSADTWFEFNTTLPDGNITGASLSCKYAPAGWENPVADSGLYSVFRSASTDPKAKKHYLQVKESDYQTLNVRGYRTMTDAISGTGIYPSAASYPNGYFWGKSFHNDANPNFWIILASDRFFYYITQSYYANSISYVFSVWFFGDLYNDDAGFAGDSIINGTTSAAEANANNSNNYVEFGASHTTTTNRVSIASDVSDITPAMDTSLYANIPAPYASFGVSGLNGFSRFDPKTNAYNLSNYYAQDSQGVTRGRLPGALYIRNSLGRNIMGQFNFENGTGDFAGKILLGIYTCANVSYRNYYPSAYDPAYMFFDVSGSWD